MNIIKQIFYLTICFLIIVFAGCSKKDKDNTFPSSNDLWDIDKIPPPQFINTNYIELSKIYKISKYRSSVGHDYSDASEHCRSMKHYFEPLGAIDWSAIKLFSPITGSITRADVEWAGTKLEIVSDKFPAFRISIFHINMITPLNVGDYVI